MCLIVYKKYQLARLNHLDMNCNFMCKKKIKSVEYTLTLRFGKYNLQD